jgi:hypothetical protein
MALGARLVELFRANSVSESGGTGGAWGTAGSASCGRNWRLTLDEMQLRWVGWSRNNSTTACSSCATGFVSASTLDTDYEPPAVGDTMLTRLQCRLASMLLVLLVLPCRFLAGAEPFPIDGEYTEISSYALTRLAKEGAGLRFGGDVNLALLSEWHRICRELDEGRIGGAADRFIGFVEGRLQLEVPTWWQQQFRQGRLSRSGPMEFDQSCSFGWNRSRRLWSTHKRRKFSGFDGVAVDGDRMTLTQGKHTFAIRQSAIHEADGDPTQWSPILDSWAVVGRLDGATAYIGFSSEVLDGPHALYAFEMSSGKLLWKADVDDGLPPLGFSGGYSGSYAEVIVDHERIAIFGGHAVAMYLNVFRKSDGRPLVRFATSYLERF